MIWLKVPDSLSEGGLMLIILLKILAAAEKAGVSSALLFSICNTETRIRNVNNMKDGGSPSYGVCQVKLRTARQFFPHFTVKDLMDPYKNALAAGTYLKYQSKRFKSTLKGISAYNAGRPIEGNKKYVNKVLKTLEEFHVVSKKNCVLY